MYQTLYKNFVVFIQQKWTNEKAENRTTLEQFMIPKIFINFIAILPDKKEKEDCDGTFTTSGGFVPPLSLNHPLYPYDIVTLPKETRTILYKNDCESVPFFENQLGVVRACKDLADLWGLPHSPESPPPPPGCVSTPTSDPSALVTPGSSPSLFSPVTEEKLAWNFGSLSTASQLMQNLSPTDFRTPSGSTTRQQQQFWRPVQAWLQQQQQQQQHLTTPRRQKSLSRQEKEGPLDPVQNSLFKNSERKLKLSV